MKIDIQGTTSFLKTSIRTVVFIGTLGAIVSFGFGVLAVEEIIKKIRQCRESKKFDPDDIWNNY